MFSVIFPGQGSQLVGMGKDLHNKYSLVQDLFQEADNTLGFSLSNLILNGPKEDLDLTENTQPAIFLILADFKSIITLSKCSILPLNTIWPTELSFAIKHSYLVLFLLIKFSIISISEPNIATIPPTPFGTELCIALPLIFNIFNVLEKDSAPAEASAEYSPKE